MLPTTILTANRQNPGTSHSQRAEAYARIKAKIVTLEMPPASLVDEAQLMYELGLGRTPIREALQQLAAENLVVILPRRGTLVADLNMSDLQKVFEIRLELEPYAARLAALRPRKAREIWNSLWGHGTSVMSPNQYRVLLALRPFGQARLPAGPARHDWPVSLEDVRPTLQEIATGTAPKGVDGISLLPYLAEPACADALAARIRYTETDFNTPSTLAGRYEASGIVDEASVYYELDTASGWVQFRPDRLAELMAQKQRAALSADRLLAALPGTPGTPARYLYADRRNPPPRCWKRR